MARTKRGDRSPRVTDAGQQSSTEGASLPIPKWLPPVLYGLVVLWLFRDFVFSDHMLYGSDTLSLGYMARKFYADALRMGVFPLWNPLILGGTPFIESLAGGDSLYPTSLLLLFIEPYRALGWKLILHVFLAGLFMFGWVRTLGCSRAAALLGGLAYALAPFLVSFVAPGHDGKLFVTSLAPLLFTATERAFVRASVLTFVGVALVVALVLFTTHFQMAYFLFGGVGTFALFRSVQLWRGTSDAPRTDDTAPATGDGEWHSAFAEGQDRPASAAGLRTAGLRFGLFLAAAMTGAAAASVQLLPAVDYVTTYSRRTATTVAAEGRDNVAYSSSWSLHPEEVMSYIVPEFAGNGAGGSPWAAGTYWGRNALKDNHEAAGLVVLLLAGLSFFGAPRRGLRYFLSGLGMVALLFALGRHTPVWRIFYELLPGISLFRAPSQASFLFGFAAVTLAAFGVDRALALARGAGGEKSETPVQYLWTAAGLVGLLMLLAASGALLTVWTSLVHSDLAPYQQAGLERAKPFIVRGFLIAALFAVATAATVWAGAKGLLKPVGVVAVLGLLLAVDALRIDAAFIETFEYRNFAAPDPNIDFLLAQQREAEPFRVVSLQRAGQDVRPAIFGIELATGHHPNDLARYRNLIGMEGSGVPEHLIPPEINVLRLLNVRYLVVPAQLGELPGTPVASQTQMGGAPYERVYEMPGLPRARLVAEAIVVPDDQAVRHILDPAFDPERTVVLAEAPPIALSGGEVEGQVRWEERGINRMRLSVVSDRPALLVIADNWFPGWQARVDGQAAPVLRAYHTLRAVPIEAGTHTVELYYRSGLLRVSLVISLATLALLLGLGATQVIRQQRAGAGGTHG